MNKLKEMIDQNILLGESSSIKRKVINDYIKLVTQKKKDISNKLEISDDAKNVNIKLY